MASELLQHNPTDGSLLSDRPVSPLLDIEFSPRYALSPFHTYGLGRQAVRWIGLVIDVEELGIEHTAEDYRFAVDLLDKARDQLADLSADERRKFQSILEDQPMPYDLNEIIGAGETMLRDPKVDKDALLIESLIAKDEKGKYKVNNMNFLSFLTWHNSVLADRQLEYDVNMSTYIQEFSDRVQLAVQDGWLPVAAGQHLERLRHLALIADDGLGTSIKGRTGGNMLLDRVEHIDIRPPEAGWRHDKERPIVSTLTHEFVHSMEGREGEAHVTRKAAEPNYGMTRLFSNKEAGRVLNEAVTEHVASSLLHGEPEHVDPGKRAEKGYTYYRERNVLHALCSEGASPVPIQSFLEVYFEDTTEDQPSKAQEILRAQLREAFPYTDVLADINEIDNIEAMFTYTLRLINRTRGYKATAKLPKPLGAAYSKVFKSHKTK